MTVVLAGVGADSTNLGALGPLYDDGGFEYVPIPEKTHQTDETETLGSWSLRGQDGTAADLTSRIDPQPVSGEAESVTGEALADWPLHHDPNFESLTYGEHRTSGYVSRLSALDPGDVVGFYAGLRRPAGDRAHRYLIGYMTVAEVTVIDPGDPIDDRRRQLAAHPENAHAKRARDGALYLDKPVVIVDGCTPGGLFDRDPIRLSDYYVKDGNERPQYYLRDSIASAFDVKAGGRNMMYKPAYRCGLSGPAFRDLVGVPGDRTSEHATIGGN